MQHSFRSPLNAEEEKHYFKQFQGGDMFARDVLIESNMRLVAHIAKKYRYNEEDMEDLISIGTIGLIKAVETFKSDKKVRLATYASRCIENELLMHCRQKKKCNRDVSLFEPVGTDKEGNQITFADIVESTDRELCESVIMKKDIVKLYQLISVVLDAREYQIIRSRYGLYNKKPCTQREIADQLGISRSYVSRIEKKALQKLKRAFE